MLIDVGAILGSFGSIGVAETGGPWLPGKNTKTMAQVEKGSEYIADIIQTDVMFLNVFLLLPLCFF